MRVTKFSMLVLAATAIGIAQFWARPALGQSAAAAAASPGAAASPAMATPMIGQMAPNVNVPPQRAQAYEPRGEFDGLANAIKSQWQPITSEIPAENTINRAFLGTADNNVATLSLKQVVYLALEHNPNIKVASLSPLAASEGVAVQNAIFDPDLTSTVDTIKTVIPATTALETRGGSTALSTKQYDWNFAINKILAQTNGTLSLTFTNDRTITNNSTETINPFYIPTLAVSLSQPLLRNFGWKFATINVRLAQSAQRQAQWTYVQSLDQMVQKIAYDYWNVVLASENLSVAQAALTFNSDLVRQNAIAVKVGTLAPLDLQEAQSAQATAEANVYTAQANLKIALATLRQDVMYNPQDTFMPQRIAPADAPGSSPQPTLDERQALEDAVEFRPSLAGLREGIRTALIQTRFQDNQILPQVNAQAQFATTSQAGNTLCGSTFGVISPNCFNSNLPGPSPNGYQLPFSGGYNSALNRMFNFSFYSYAIVLTFERPLANASANAALAQARIGMQQSREQYRAALSQAVVDVQSGLASVNADVERVKATQSATFYARQSLHDEEVRFRVGMATTHDLLQFQEEEVSAEGNEVQAKIDLENAKISLLHATGQLLRSFQVTFELQGTGETPWFAHM